MEDKGSKAGEEERAKIREEIDFLRKADVLVLNEVDWGVNRTLFRNVADELARALNMNYAYGVEFVEVDPSILLSVAITVEPSTQLTTQFQNEYPITIPLRSTCLGTTARSTGLSTRRLLQVDLHLLNGKKLFACLNSGIGLPVRRCRLGGDASTWEAEIRHIRGRKAVRWRNSGLSEESGSGKKAPISTEAVVDVAEH